MSTTETPSLLDVIQLAIDVDRAELHVAVPARVESYDAAAQTVTVTPTTKAVSRNADDDRIVDVLPVLPAIPVEWPRGGGYFLCMPLVQGDEGLLIFTDTDLGAWRDSGQVSDPGDERRHAIGGAVFRPGLCSVARVLTGAATGHLVLGKEGGPTIHIDGSFVQLGAAGGTVVVLASSAFQTWVNQVTTFINGSAPGTITPPPPTSGAFAATKVKGT
jgi:Phage protein Gp138 N-terminal domain